MQKVYLILRNNKQEGPYDLQQLLQLPLKETDLIWVEGRSAAWSYPSEIRELKPYFSTTIKESTEHHSAQGKTNQNTITPNSEAGKAKHIFVSLPHQTNTTPPTKEPTPEEVLNLKAEALRQKVQAYQNTHPVGELELIETNLQRSLDDVAGDYANWAIRSKAKKRKSVPVKPLLLGTVLIITAISIWWLFSPDATTEKEQKATTPVTQEYTSNTVSQHGEVPVTEPITLETDKPLQETIVKENKKTRVNNSSAGNEASTVTILPEETPIVSGPIVENEIPVIEKGKAEEEATTEEKKKKSLGEAIDGFFGKFKNKKDEADKEHTTIGGERKSTKRGETNTNEAVTVDVTDAVKISTNKQSDNWMLGVQGLKLTLQNQSSVVVTNAVVEVQYFGEDETLLDKKVIEFKNIKPNQKSTMPVPDHRLANHTSHKIISATGIANN